MFLNYDPNAISQLLAQPRGPGAALQSIGQTMQMYGQIQQQKAKQKQEDEIFELQKTIKNLGIKGEKIQQAEQHVEYTAGIGNTVLGLYNKQGKLKDPAGAQLAYAEIYNKAIQDMPALEQVLPKTVPSQATANNWLNQSYKWSEAKRREEEFQQQQQRLKEAEKAREAKERAFNVTKTSEQDFVSAGIFLKQAGIKDSLDAPGVGGDKDAEISVTKYIADRANQLVAEGKQSGRSVNYTDAQSAALDELKNTGVLVYNPSTLWGDNWDFKPEAYNKLVGIKEPETTKQESKKPADKKQETKPIDKVRENKIDIFMKNNNISDRVEAENILVENGILQKK